MAEANDRYLKEAQDVIGAGNKAFGLFLLAALIWWIANLFPFNLSERAANVLENRLQDFSRLARKADAVCQGAVDKYINQRTESIFSRGQDKVAKCLAQNPPTRPSHKIHADLYSNVLHA